MRRILALGCCALYLAFGFVAGAAHLHESADHHAESRGLHLDHTHVGNSADHQQEPRIENESSHDGDVVYLSAPALRSIDSGVRLMPATVAVGATIDPPSTISDWDQEMPRRPRDPPRTTRIRPRAPPA
jgi:hypothetical protein